MGKKTGRVFLDVPGWGRFDSKPGASMSPGGFNREDVDSDVEAADYSERPARAQVSFVINHGPDIDVVDLGKITGVDITFSTDTGQSYLIQGGYVSEPPDMTGGEVSVTMKGKPARRVS